MSELIVNTQINRPQKGDTVSIHYSGKLEDGVVFDSSEGMGPLQFVVGEEQVIQGLDEAVLEMERGESKTVSIPVEKAYGQYNNEFVKTLDRREFPPELELNEGQKLEITGHDGINRIATVISVSESSVTLDGNHPLAGKNLIFDIELIDINPSFIHLSEIYFQEGLRFQKSGRIEEAIHCYQKTTEFNPEHAAAFCNMGAAYQQEGDNNRAMMYYQIALQLDPAYAEAYVNIGRAFKERDLSDTAEAIFQKAIDVKPGYAPAYYNLGTMKVLKGKYQEAFSLFKKAVELEPDHAEAHREIERVNLLLRNLED
jgi:peptidylprolyl isomerase